MTSEMKKRWNRVRHARKGNRRVFKKMMSFLHSKYPDQFKSAFLTKGDILTDMLELLYEKHPREFYRFKREIRKNDEKVLRWMARI